jgi:hypothetical protein
MTSFVSCERDARDARRQPVTLVVCGSATVTGNIVNANTYSQELMALDLRRARSTFCVTSCVALTLVSAIVSCTMTVQLQLLRLEDDAVVHSAQVVQAVPFGTNRYTAATVTLQSTVAPGVYYMALHVDADTVANSIYAVVGQANARAALTALPAALTRACVPRAAALVQLTRCFTQALAGEYVAARSWESTPMYLDLSRAAGGGATCVSASLDLTLGSTYNTYVDVTLQLLRQQDEAVLASLTQQTSVLADPVLVSLTPVLQCVVPPGVYYLQVHVVDELSVHDGVPAGRFNATAMLLEL